MKTQKRIAARILKIGETKVWMDPDRMPDIAEAITTDDVHKLIRTKTIKKRATKGQSTHRAKTRRKQKKSGRQKGQGKRKGTKKSRYPKKQKWIKLVRGLRNALKKMKGEKYLNQSEYRKLYTMSKSGALRSKSHLRLQIKKEKSR